MRRLQFWCSLVIMTFLLPISQFAEATGVVDPDPLIFFTFNGEAGLQLSWSTVATPALEDGVGFLVPGDRTYFQTNATVTYVTVGTIDATIKYYAAGGFSMLENDGKALLTNNMMSFSGPVLWTGDVSTPEFSVGKFSGTYILGSDPIGTLSVQAAPVPEPSTVALLSLGLAGLGFSRRKKA